ncbi:MAG: hypothetical protein ABIN61_02680 [candidate division WOR-3 bacterium]
MRKIYLILLLSLSLFGVSKLKINGDSVATIIIGDTLFLEVNLDGDSLASLEVYMDLNNNGILEEGEPPLYYGCLIDGSWEDIDEKKNIYFSTVVRSSKIEIPTGDFIVIVRDEAGLDQAILHVQPPIGGPLTGKIFFPSPLPINASGVLVKAVPCFKDAAQEEIGSLIDITNQEGEYSISVPTLQYYKILTLPPNEVFPGFLGTLSRDSAIPGEKSLDDTLIATDGSLFKCIFLKEMTQEPPTPYTSPIMTFISGLFIDPSGMIETLIPCFKTGVGKLGEGSFLLRSSSLGNSWEVEFFQKYDPYSMTPPKRSFSFVEVPDTIIDTIIVEPCDAQIAGTVFVDGVPTDGIEVWAFSPGIGKAPSSGTFSTGFYRLLVSSKPMSYTVGLSDFPDSLYGGPKNVSPGSSGVNFYVKTMGIKEEERSSNLEAFPTLLISSTLLEVKGVTKKDAALKLFDVTGKMVGVIPQKEFIGNTARYEIDINRLPGGILFGKIENEKGTIKLTLLR